MAAVHQQANWWVRQQHEQFTVLQSDRQPDTNHKPGERRIRMWGPFATRDQAQSFSDRQFSQTVAGRYGREAR